MGVNRISTVSRVMTTPHIRMIDQHEFLVELEVRQDGKAPGLVAPGKRTRFKLRARAYRVESLVLPECPEHWLVHDICVGTRSQFTAKGDSPEEDGVPGEVFASGTESFLRFETTQTAMDLVLDVSYHGPMEAGAPFCCHLRCTAAYDR
jgi:hypothetical protein